MSHLIFCSNYSLSTIWFNHVATLLIGDSADASYLPRFQFFFFCVECMWLRILVTDYVALIMGLSYRWCMHSVSGMPEGKEWRYLWTIRTVHLVSSSTALTRRSWGSAGRKQLLKLIYFLYLLNLSLAIPLKISGLVTYVSNHEFIRNLFRQSLAAFSMGIRLLFSNLGWGGRWYINASHN